MLHGIALACVVVCGWALLTKVFPGALAEDEIYARLRAPFDYWNSVGLTAALGILAAAVARRAAHGPRRGRTRSPGPGIALLEVALMLVVLARRAAGARASGSSFWFAVVPLRLRGAVVLLGATAGAAPVDRLGVRHDRAQHGPAADPGARRHRATSSARCCC